MSKMKNHAMDTEAAQMLAIVCAVSNERDEYRDEMNRLREENEMLHALASQAIRALLIRSTNEAAHV